MDGCRDNENITHDPVMSHKANQNGKRILSEVDVNDPFPNWNQLLNLKYVMSIYMTNKNDRKCLDLKHFCNMGYTCQ